MLHGVLIYPGEPEGSFISSLRTIRLVKWEAVLVSPEGEDHGVYDGILPKHCNLVVILDPDFTSYGYLSGLVRSGCHLFLTEKQKMNSSERMKLIQLAEEGNTSIQIRNDLQFHPSFKNGGKNGTESKLIEIHHVVPGKPGRLPEMMYSNLLMTLKIIDSEPSRVSVFSIPNSGFQPDLVNLHLNFQNGSAASLTLSFTGLKKEHLLSVHSAKGVKTYNFKEDNYQTLEFAPGQEHSQLFENALLVKQIADFSQSILRKSYQRSGLSEETKTFHLIEKINQKLEFSSVLI